MISCLLLLLMLCIRRYPLVLGTTRPCCRSARVPQGLEGRQRRFAFSFNICLFAFFFFIFSCLVLVVAVSDPPAEGGGINSRPPALFVTGCYYIEYNRPRLAPHEYAKKVRGAYLVCCGGHPRGGGIPCAVRSAGTSRAHADLLVYVCIRLQCLLCLCTHVSVHVSGRAGRPLGKHGGRPWGQAGRVCKTGVVTVAPVVVESQWAVGSGTRAAG